MQRQDRYQNARQFKARHYTQGWLVRPGCKLRRTISLSGCDLLSSNAVFSDAMTDTLP